MAMTVHNVLPHFTAAFKSKSKTTPRQDSKRLSVNSVRCCQLATFDKRLITVSNGNDSLDICRVLNGMWQTSGGWGRIDRDDAVDAMLRYADAGLTTFDMADHCMLQNPKSFYGDDVVVIYWTVINAFLKTKLFLYLRVAFLVYPRIMFE